MRVDIFAVTQEEARQEWMRYITFIFASSIHLVRGYIDQLTQNWEGHGEMATSVKMVHMLLECYELHYRSDQDIGVDKVYTLKQRLGKTPLTLSYMDMPEKINNRTMSIGYNRLRMVLFSIATQTNTQITSAHSPIRN